MKKFWEKFKVWFNTKFWQKLKDWTKSKFWPWFKRDWHIIGSIIMLIICYGVLPEESVLGMFVGLWLFVLAGLGLWKLFNYKK